MSGLAQRLVMPVVIGRRRFPSVGLLVLATIGASLLLILAATEWRHLNDEYAYWLAGSHLAAGTQIYDTTAAPGTPYAYWYPPPLAEVIAPLTAFISADAFAVAWTALLLVCLWWLAGRNLFVALALIAFLPVAVELRVRNVHLLLAVLAVLALRRSALFWVPAAALKITPILGYQLVLYRALTITPSVRFKRIFLRRFLVLFLARRLLFLVRCGMKIRIPLSMLRSM